MTRQFLALLAVLPFGLAAQNGAPVIDVPVTIERDNRTGSAAVADADLTVFVDGQPRPFVTVGTANPTILLLVDLSHSATCCTSPLITLGHNHDALLRGIRRVLVNGLQPNERLRIGRVGSKGMILAPQYSSNRTALTDSISAMLDLNRVDSAERAGPSPIWDAVVAGATALAAEPAPRLLILVTDGEATGNRLGVQDAAERAVAAGVVVDVLFTPWMGFSGRPSTRDEVARGAPARSQYVVPGMEQLLGQLAEATGGVLRTYESDTAQSTWETVPRFDDMLEALRSTRTVRISLSRLSAEPQTLSVRSTQPGITVRAPTRLVVPSTGQVR